MYVSLLHTTDALVRLSGILKLGSDLRRGTESPFNKGQEHRTR